MLQNKSQQEMKKLLCSVKFTDKVPGKPRNDLFKIISLSENPHKLGNNGLCGHVSGRENASFGGIDAKVYLKPQKGAAHDD